MDFIVSYYMMRKIRGSTSLHDTCMSDTRLHDPREIIIVPRRKTCSKCGQNPYFCICQTVTEQKVTDQKVTDHKFDFENSEY